MYDCNVRAAHNGFISINPKKGTPSFINLSPLQFLDPLGLAMLCSTQRCITAHYITATPHLKTPLPKTRRGPSCQQTVGSNQAPHHCLDHCNINLNLVQYCNDCNMSPSYLVYKSPEIGYIGTKSEPSVKPLIQFSLLTCRFIIASATSQCPLPEHVPTAAQRLRPSGRIPVDCKADRAHLHLQPAAFRT